MNNREIESTFRDTISLSKFLYQYVGIKLVDEVLNMSHDDIKYLFPFLKRISFSSLLKRMDDYYTGNVIIVRDFSGQYIPYMNPKINLEMNVNSKKECIYNFERLLSELNKKSLNELIRLKKICKIYGKRTEFYKI